MLLDAVLCVSLSVWTAHGMRNMTSFGWIIISIIKSGQDYNDWRH